MCIKIAYLSAIGIEEKGEMKSYQVVPTNTRNDVSNSTVGNTDDHYPRIPLEENVECTLPLPSTVIEQPSQVKVYKLGTQ